MNRCSFCASRVPETENAHSKGISDELVDTQIPQLGKSYTGLMVFVAGSLKLCCVYGLR